MLLCLVCRCVVPMLGSCLHGICITACGCIFCCQVISLFKCMDGVWVNDCYGLFFSLFIAYSLLLLWTVWTGLNSHD